MQVPYIYAYICIDIYAYIRRYRIYMRMYALIYTRMYALIYTRIYACTYIYAYICTDMYSICAYDEDTHITVKRTHSSKENTF